MFSRLFKGPHGRPASRPTITGLLAATLFALFGLVSPAFGGATCTNAGATSATSWTRWECTLDVQGVGSTLSGRNPYLMKLKVTYMATGQETRTGYAFWDGGVPGTTKQRFRMRMHFPPSASPTTWTWTTTCETPSFCSADTSKTDPSLVSTGTVTVSAYSGSNPLYQGGPIRFLANTFNPIPEPYQGNQRFSWIGDSAWVGPLRATAADWDSYLENRRSASNPAGATSANVSILHVGSTAPDWAKLEGKRVDKNGNPPFDQLGGCSSSGKVPNACSVPNLAFWRAFEEKLDKANQKGLYIFLAGLMEPYDRYPATDEAVRFACWLVGRLTGNFVLFSPGFDSPPTGTAATDLIKAVGTAIQATSPAHPITNHWSTSVDDVSVTYNQMASIHREPWFGFALYQSGHMDGDEPKIANRAREMAQVVGGYTNHATFGAVRHATVNGEAVYDDGSTATTSRPAFRAYRARHAGYASWLAGSFGYTHGTGGIWDWGACGASLPNVCNFQTPSEFRNFSTAMAIDKQSFKNVKFLGDAIRKTASARLLFSEQVRIKNQSSEEVKKMVVARSSKFMLVYLPHNENVKLDYGNMNKDTAKLWNPATGGPSTVTDIPETGCIANTTICTFPNRDNDDLNPDISDRLIVLAPGASNTWFLTDPNQLDVIAARFVEGQPIGLFGRQLDPTGKPVSRYFEIHNVAGQEPRDPAVGRNGRGSFLVVWSMDADGDSLQEVWGKWILPTGSERPPVFRISPADGSEHFEPAVAINGEGVAFVSWTRARWPIHNREIWSRSVNGGSLGEPEALCAYAQADCSASKVAASLAGAVTVAWVESELATGLERIVLHAFGNGDLRRPFTLAQQVNTSIGPSFWLHHLHIDAAGVVVAEFEGIEGGASAGIYTQAFDAVGKRQGGELLKAPPVGSSDITSGDP